MMKLEVFLKLCEIVGFFRPPALILQRERVERGIELERESKRERERDKEREREITVHFGMLCDSSFLVHYYFKTIFKI